MTASKYNDLTSIAKPIFVCVCSQLLGTKRHFPGRKKHNDFFIPTCFIPEKNAQWREDITVLLEIQPWCFFFFPVKVQRSSHKSERSLVGPNKWYCGWMGEKLAAAKFQMLVVERLPPSILGTNSTVHGAHSTLGRWKWEISKQRRSPCSLLSVFCCRAPSRLHWGIKVHSRPLTLSALFLHSWKNEWKHHCTTTASFDASTTYGAGCRATRQLNPAA